MASMYLAVMFLIIALAPAFFLPSDANTPADPLKTPPHIRPEWYFLAPYQMLKLIPNKFLGITLQIIIMSIFIFWPFIDAHQEKNIQKPVLRRIFIAGLVLWVILTYLKKR